jgi:host factor-I protein
MRRIASSAYPGMPKHNYNDTMPFRTSQPALNKKGKTPPPEETFEEAAYLKQLGESQKTVTIKLVGGEVVRGWVEYYDRNMIRLTREGAPNLFIFKHEIMYISEGTMKDPTRKRADAARTAATRAAKAKLEEPVSSGPLTPESSEG